MAYTDEVIADSPSLYWHLDDTGSTAADASGNGRTGTYGGTPTLSAAPLITTGTSVDFDAISDYCLSDAVLNVSSATVEVWWDYSGTPPTTAAAYYVAGFTEGNGGSVGDKILLINDSGVPVFYVFDGSPQFAIGATPLSAGVHHLVGTIDGPANELKVYDNGAQTGSTATATSSYAAYSNPNVLVAGSSTAQPSLGGVVGRRDEFAVYGTALSAARILAHYQTGISEGVQSQVLAMQHHVFGHNVW